MPTNHSINEFPPSPLKIAFEKRRNSPAITTLKQLIRTGNPILKLVYKKAAASYWIRESELGFSLHKPNKQRPVFKSVPIDNHSQGIQTFYQNILQVAHFEKVSQFKSPDSKLELEEVLDLEFHKILHHKNYQEVAEEDLVKLNLNEPAFFNYHYVNDQAIEPAFQLSLQNKSEKSLWVTALFMAENFSIRDSFLPVKELKPNTLPYEFSKSFQGTAFKIIPLGIGNELMSWGVNEIKNQIKIIVSSQPFSIENLLQNGLKQESNEVRESNFSEKTLEGFSSQMKGDWVAKDLSITIHRPLNGVSFNQAESAKLPGVEIQTHSDCTAQLVRLTASEEITRSGTSSVAAPTAIFNSEFIQPFQGHGTRALEQVLDVLELHGVEGAEKVNPDNPLKLKLDFPLENGKVVLPFGYDKELDIYIPMGFVGEDGQSIHIDELPDPTEASNRGLFKSIKIFLVETVRKITGKKPKYPILAQAMVDKEENLDYITDENVIKTAVDKADCILVMVHGLIGDTSDKAKIMERIKEPGTGRTLSQIYDVLLTFDYESMNRKIEKTGKNLREKLESVGIKAGHGKKIHIIAHSMGGLVSRWYLEKEGGQEVINHFIQVGSPNLGSPIANKAQLATTALGAILNFIPKPPLVAGAIRIVGALWNRVTVTTRQLKPTSKFYKKLNQTPLNVTIPYTILPGDVTLVEDTRQRKFFAKMIERYKQNLFQEGNDGVVGVSSIKGVPVPSGRMVKRLEPIPCNHFSYFNTKAGEVELARVLFELADT